MFQCDLTQNLEVSSIDYNRTNDDLVVVGYSGSSYGLIAFWTIKNPSYPEKFIRTNSAVTSIEFSKVKPWLLGVGHKDGTVAIYDLRKESDW